MLRLLCSAIGKCNKSFIGHDVNYQIRSFFAILRVAFNRVDSQRLKEVGPDRLCAEW